jgi:hypothetical protein
LKFLLRTLSIAAVLVLSANVTLACTCVSASLGKRFRKAKAVFVGRLTPAPSDKELVQNYTGEDRDSQTLKVVKAFKGIRRKFISVTFDVQNLAHVGSCPALYYFKPERDYLVFAYGSKYEVQTVCSDTWEIPADKESPGYDQMQGYIKKLDSFWFRLGARLNPF